jgi:hypothetical protein
MRSRHESTPKSREVLRGVTDELGVTTPKEAKRRPRRKGPLKVVALRPRRIGRR